MLERYPPVNITPEEYEQQVVSWLRQEEKLQSFQVQHREKLVGLAGEYTFDGVARFNAVGGAEFVVLIECKKHSRPVERDCVLVLHQKLLDVGAQKAMIFSTAGFQRGAIEYADKHGIAAVYFADGRTSFVSRSREETKMQRHPVHGWLYVGWLITPSGPHSEQRSLLTENTLQSWLES